MANKKITELSQVTTLPDEALFTAVDSTRASGDQNVKITKLDLANDIDGGSGTLEKDVNQVGHGFVAGNVVRLDGGTYVLSQADAVANANAISFVTEVVDVDNFKVQSESYISVSLGLSNGEEAFLSTTVAGGIQTTEPDNGEVNVYLGQQTPQGFLISISTGFVVGSGGEGGGIESIVAGDNITVDNTDPKNPIVSATGGSTPSAKTIVNHGFYTDGDRIYERWNEQVSVAEGGEIINGTAVNTFRIPSCVYAENGDLLVFSEARFSDDTDAADAGIFLARLRGHSILEKEILIPNGVGVNKTSNPNVFRDGSTIYLFHAEFDLLGSPDLTNVPKLYYSTSTDNGVTWSAKTEYLVGDQVVGSAFKYLNAPGNSIKHSSGNIIIPAWGKYVGGSSPTWFRSGIIVWDGATTFTKRFLDTVDSINEPTVYEDSNGDIVMSCRTGSSGANQRVVYRTSDLGATWVIDPSSGADSFSVYVNIKKYADKLYRLEIDDGAVSAARKNLNLYTTDLTNQKYFKVLDVTPRGQEIWGYGCSDNYLDNFAIVSEDKPNLNLYLANIKDKGVLKVNRKTPLESLGFFSSLRTDGTDLVGGLSATNGGAATFNGSFVSFNATDTSFITYPDNDVFDWTDGTKDIPASLALLCRFRNTSENSLFLNKNGVLGTNRTWEIRTFSPDGGVSYNLRFYMYSELANSPNIYYETTDSIPLTEWFSLIMSQDGNGNPIVYINNVASGSITDGGYVKMGNSGNVLTLGRLQSSSTFNTDGDFYGLTVLKGRVFSDIERDWIYQSHKNFIDLLP